MKRLGFCLAGLVFVSFFACCGKSQVTSRDHSVSDVNAEMARIKEQLKTEPNSAELHAQLAALAAAKADWETFDSEIATSIRLDPTKVTTYFGAAEVLRRRGLSKKAFEMLDKALSQDPKNPLAHFFLGTFYQQETNVENAEREFKLTKSLITDLRLQSPSSANRIEGDIYYDSRGNTYMVERLEKRVDERLLQLKSPKR